MICDMDFQNVVDLSLELDIDFSTDVLCDTVA